MHIEFTKLPDPERDRHDVRRQIMMLFRRRLWVSVLIFALAGLLGVGNMASGDRVFGATMLVFAAAYLALLPLGVRTSTARAYRRLAKLNSVPVHITITDIDITFARPWNYASWAWVGVDAVADLGSLLVGRCGEAPVFTVPLYAMPPESVAELRAFLTDCGLLDARQPRGRKIASPRAAPGDSGDTSVRSATPPIDSDPWDRP
jgi:hypothetical protein